MGTVGDRAFNNTNEIAFLGSRLPRHIARKEGAEQKLPLPQDLHGEQDPTQQSPMEKASSRMIQPGKRI